MRVTTQLLADYASVRDGLLYIVGGGVNRIRKKKPGALNVYLTLALSADDLDDLTRRHEILIEVIHRDSAKVLTSSTVKWEGNLMDAPDARELIHPIPSIPLALPLKSAEVLENGDHLVQIKIDGELAGRLEFLVSGIGE